MLLNRNTNLCHFFVQKKITTKLNMQTYVLNELQWLSICASGKQSDRLTDMASDRPALTYQRIIIIYKMLKLFSKVKNTTIVKEKLILIQIFFNKNNDRCSFFLHFFSLLISCICIPSLVRLPLSDFFLHFNDWLNDR